MSPQEPAADSCSGGAGVSLLAVEASAAAEDAVEGPKRRSWGAPICGMLLSVFCVLSGLLQIQIYRKFTPVYTETECGNQTAMMDRMSLGSDSISIGLQIQVTCKNPNPYGITILASDPGDTYVQFKDEANRIPLGKLAVVPGSALPQNGHGIIRVRMDTVVRGEQADILLPHMLSDRAIPIMMQLQFKVGVNIAFGFVSWSIEAPFKKACGLNMAGVLVNQFLPTDNSERSNRLGPLICRNSFDGLIEQLPPVGEKAETPEDGNMGFSAAQVAPEEVEAGELLKTTSLGISITLTFFSSLVFALGSLACFGHPEGLRGVLSVVRGPCGCCGFSLSKLVLLAWNGALELLVLSLGSWLRPHLEGLRVPSEKLQPRPRMPSEGGFCPCPRLPWSASTSPTQRDVGVDFVDRDSASESVQRFFNFGFERTTVPDVGRGRSAPGICPGGPASPVKKVGFNDWRGGAYHRLDMESGSPERVPLQAGGCGSSPHKAVTRSHTAPLIAVSARRTDMMEASAWDGERPPSPPRPPQRSVSRNSNTERMSRSSSAAYVPELPAPSGAGSPATVAGDFGGASPSAWSASAAPVGQEAVVSELPRAPPFEQDRSQRWPAGRAPTNFTAAR